MDDYGQDTLDLINEIRDEYPRIWARGEDFLADVEAKILAVRETVAQTGHVSPRQQAALDNWDAGVRRWHPDHRDD